MLSDDPRAVIRRAYREVDHGFEIPASEEQTIRKTRGSPVYGEITPAAVKKLVDYLEMSSGDVFYDLGSGVGKVVNQVAMTVPLKRCVGVELSRSRIATSRSVLRKLRAEDRIVARRTVHRCENILEADLSDATVIYTCSTAFSWRFLARVCRKIRELERELLFVSVQELEDDTRGFEHIETLRLDMTWQRRDAVYVYYVAGS